MSAAIPSAFPPWSISPSPLRNTSTLDTSTAATAGAIVGGFLFFFVVAAAIFTLRRRLSLSRTKKYNGKWHNMESNGGRKIVLPLTAATHAPQADHTYHDTKVVTAAPGVQDHGSCVCPYGDELQGRLGKPSPLDAP